MPSVTPVRLWCLAIGHVDELVGVEERLEHRPFAEDLALEIDRREEARLRAARPRRRPPARRPRCRCVRSRLPRRCSVTSVTMTEPAPAARQRRTISATTSGLVVAACSGRRSHATLGLMTTVSPRVTKRDMPPISSRARRTSAAGVAAVPWATTISGRSAARRRGGRARTPARAASRGRRLRVARYPPRPSVAALAPPSRRTRSRKARRSAARSGTVIGTSSSRVA